MRFIIFLVISFYLAGCATPSSKQTASVTSNVQQQYAAADDRQLTEMKQEQQPASSFYDVSPPFVTFNDEQIAEMKQKLELLRPKMDLQQALTVLGLSKYKGHLDIGGASSGYTANINCKLAEGHNLWMSYGYTTADRSTNVIIEARIDDQIWRATKH